MTHVHDFRYDGKPGLLLCNGKKLQALGLEALEIVRGGSGLERAAAQQLRARLFHVVRNAYDLLLGLDGARARDHREVAAADFDAAHVDNGIVRMELAVAAFEGVGHAANGVDNIEARNQIHVDRLGVADQTKDGLIIALRNMHAKILGFEPANQLVTASFTYIWFQNYDHGLAPPKK